MSKYTPGPWITEGAGIYAKQPTFRVALAEMKIFPGDETECMANGQLIAAAPDLLEFAKKYEESEGHIRAIHETAGCPLNGTSDCLYCMAVEAIKKAEGGGQ